MDGLTVNRTTTTPGAWRPVAPAAPTPTGGTAVGADELALGRIRQAAQDAAAGVAPAGGATPPGASAEQLIAEVAERLKTAQGLDAKRLTVFAAVVASTAGDPAATAMLAQAFRSPGAGEGAARLHRLILQGDENTLSHLYYTAAVDDPEFGEQLHTAFPQNVFSSDLTGASVLASTVREIFDPQNCLQFDKQTCGAASAQIMIAREAPEEYVRMVTGLAFHGAATLQSGAVLRREPDWHGGPADQRSLTSMMLQSSFMELANGQDEYLASQDATTPTDRNGGARKGLTSVEMQRLLTSLVNSPTENVQIKNWDSGSRRWVARDAVSFQDSLARIDQMNRLGWSVPVLVSVRPDQEFGHYQLITRIEGDTVYGLNPWGQEQPMSRHEFEQRLITSFFQQA